MPGLPLTTDAFVLLKRPPTDTFQTLTVFSAEHGTLTVLQRIAKKSPSASPPLDLFDEATLFLESSNQGRTWFIKESRLITRHSDLGRSYETLVSASALAGLISRNSVHEETRPAVAILLRTALASLAQGARPDIVYFKSLFCFARDEGYPLKQEWFPTLPATERTNVAALLNLPLAAQTLPAAQVHPLEQRLEAYLRAHTEILFD